jgi:hypothetical protein
VTGTGIAVIETVIGTVMVAAGIDVIVNGTATKSITQAEVWLLVGPSQVTSNLLSTGWRMKNPQPTFG